MPKKPLHPVPDPYAGSAELIVVAHPEAGLRAHGASVAAAAADVLPLSHLLESTGTIMVPLFGPTEERVRAATASAAEAGGAALPDMSLFYRVRAPDDRLHEMAEALNAQEAVEAAFVKPAAVVARINDMAPAADEAPTTTPDFTSRQLYLNAAPVGVDARFGWTQAGGSGAGVRVIDIEGAWRFTHEDLRQNQGGVVGGTPINDLGWRNHGTAVVGVIGADRNAFGVTGITPDAFTSAVSIQPGGSAWAIRYAADRLGPGDIILIELHRPGPRFNFQSPQGQRGYIAVEWWPDDFAAIQYATSKGIIVVEAAGNGAENLDDPLYDKNPASPYGPFPSWWRNPFRRNPLDSRAIVVGAGAPPPGTHGRNWGPDRSRLDFSNYGALVDAQGWGREVTTTGYGDLQGGANEDLWYTDQFSGTSSASPIVVGSVAAVQGVLKARGQPVLDPAKARALLRATGSPQQPSPAAPVTQRIGSRPDIRQMVAKVTPSQGQTVPLYRYWNVAVADHFYTTNWNELGTGRLGYTYEGVQCYVSPQPRTGAVPLHRYYNAAATDHFYTTNWNELGSGRYGYAYEGIQCYVQAAQQPGSTPLYRYWNPGGADHFYTTSWTELGGGRYGWGYEGIQCYVWPSAVALPPQADAPTTAAEPTAEPVAAGEPVAVGEARSGIPGTFRMGAPVDAPELVGAAAQDGPEGGAQPRGDSFLTAQPLPDWFRVAQMDGAPPARRGRAMTVTFSLGGDEG